MEFIITVLMALILIAAVDAAALTWGVDTRDGMLDDRAR